MPNKDYQYDVFISYASEDRDFVLPLAKRLRGIGVEVWVDRFMLKPGDKISLSIGEGLAKSRYGVVVLGPNFLKKDYPKHELSGLMDKAISGNRLLPIWHGITREKVYELHPSLADIFAIKSDIGSKNAAIELAKVVRPDLVPEKIYFKLKKVPISSLKSGPIRYKKLPQYFIDRVKIINEKLKEVDVSSLEKTLDGFKRDLHPESELRIWEYIAEVYTEFVSAKEPLSLDQKREIFGILLSASMKKLDAEDFKRLKYLDQKTAEFLAVRYYNLVEQSMARDRHYNLVGILKK